MVPPVSWMKQACTAQSHNSRTQLKNPNIILCSIRAPLFTKDKEVEIWRCQKSSTKGREAITRCREIPSLLLLLLMKLSSSSQFQPSLISPRKEPWRNQSTSNLCLSLGKKINKSERRRRSISRCTPTQIRQDLIMQVPREKEWSEK